MITSINISKENYIRLKEIDKKLSKKCYKVVGYSKIVNELVNRLFTSEALLNDIESRIVELYKNRILKKYAIFDKTSER